MTTRDKALRNVFLFVRDTNTGQVSRTVIPGDLQIGLRNNPAAMELHGKLAINVTDYTVDASNKGIINISPDDTIVSVNVEEVPATSEVQLVLPANPTKGEVHFFKDVSGLASSSFPIKIIPQDNVTIDGESEKQIIDANGSIAVFWFRGTWRVLVSGVGLATAGTAPVNSTYVTISNDSTLTNERMLTGSSNVDVVDNGANSSVQVDITDTGVVPGSYTAASLTVDSKGRISAASSNALGGGGNGDANARYILTEATGSLANAFVLEAGPNITLNSGSGVVSITGSAGGGGNSAQVTTLTTTDATPTQILSEKIFTDEVRIFNAVVTARDQATGDSAGWIISNVFENSSGSTNELNSSGTITFQEKENNSWNIYMSSSNAYANVMVVGNPTGSVDWTAYWDLSGSAYASGGSSGLDSDWSIGTNSGLYTTSSVSIGTGDDALAQGTDTSFFVSGSTDGLNIAVFGGDVLISGSLTIDGTFTPSTGSISSSYTSNPSTLNFSTEGTLDWFAPGGTAAQNYRTSPLGHGKRLGGWMHQSFDWSGFSGMSTFTQGSSMTISSTGTDDHADSAMSSVATDQGYFASSVVGLGYRFRVPAGTKTRVLRIYGSVYSCGVILTAKTSDGDGVHVDVQPGPTTAVQETFWEITYNSERDGQELCIDVQAYVDNGGVPNVKFIGATLART